jgi:hypothetical protein
LTFACDAKSCIFTVHYESAVFFAGYFLYRLVLGFMRFFLLCLCFCATPLAAQDVVINKYRNGGNAQSGDGDVVELLVIRDGLDLRGFILRDFAIAAVTGSLLVDSVTSGSGSFRFSQNSAWQRVPAGTLVNVVFGDNRFTNSADTVISVGLGNTLYFSSTGNFNIGASDMVMLKRPNSPVGGTAGSVHAFSAGITFANLTGIVPLLRTSDEAGTARPIALPDNIAGNLSDYSGSRAGTAAMVSFGSANNPANQRFIDSLRRTRMPTSVRNNGFSPVPLTIAPVPANDECVVSFRMHMPEMVVISLVGAPGNRREMYRSYLAAGEQSVRLSLADVATGMYFMVVTGNEVRLQRLLIITR